MGEKDKDKEIRKMWEEKVAEEKKNQAKAKGSSSSSSYGKARFYKKDIVRIASDAESEHKGLRGVVIQVDGVPGLNNIKLEAERSGHEVGGPQREAAHERREALARGKATASVIGTRKMGRLKRM